MPHVPVKPRTVYARMVADIFHRGHVAYLAAARALGDRLVVYVIDDAHAAAVKRPPLLSQADALPPGARVLLVDDVLATGGTLAAARGLADALQADVVGAAVLIELDFLGGRARWNGDAPLRAAWVP